MGTALEFNCCDSDKKLLQCSTCLLSTSCIQLLNNSDLRSVIGSVGWVGRKCYGVLKPSFSVEEAALFGVTAKQPLLVEDT